MNSSRFVGYTLLMCCVTVTVNESKIQVFFSILHVFCLIFCQDFGDYQDGYYSVQTTEGEQIAQLIAGYIDIILKKVSCNIKSILYMSIVTT